MENYILKSDLKMVTKSFAKIEAQSWCWLKHRYIIFFQTLFLNSRIRSFQKWCKKWSRLLSKRCRVFFFQNLFSHSGSFQNDIRNGLGCLVNAVENFFQNFFWNSRSFQKWYQKWSRMLSKHCRGFFSQIDIVFLTFKKTFYFVFYLLKLK